MRVRWTRPALDNLDEIQAYVAQESPTAAHRLVNDLYDRTQRLLSVTPEIGRLGRVRQTRELVFSEVPYIVAYRVTSDVEILAVVHTARRWPRVFE